MKTENKKVENEFSIEELRILLEAVATTKTTTGREAYLWHKLDSMIIERKRKLS